MKTRLILVVSVLALALTLVLVACSEVKDEVAPAAAPATAPATAPAALDAKALVQERCTQCHDLQRVEAAKKTRDEWKTTVERMVSLGAKLDEAEQEAAIDYLAEAYPK